MAKKTNCVINGKEYYRIYRKVGMKVNKQGLWVDDYKNFYGSCKREAEQKYQQYMEKRETSGKGTAENRKCLGELVDQWIDTIFKFSNLANSTKTNYINSYRKHFRRSDLAGRRMDDITPLQLQQFYNDSGLPYGAVRSVHNLLIRFYKYVELNGLGNDITRCIAVPKNEQQEDQTSCEAEKIDVWKDEELQKVIAALDGTTRRFLVVLAVNAGLRISELLAVRYNDIRDGILYVNKQLTDIEDVQTGETGARLKELKTPSSIRAVPLSSAVLQELEQHRLLHNIEMLANGYRTEAIFTTSTGKYYNSRNITRSLTRLYKRIGVPHHKFHAYRATFGTNLSRAKVPIEETSRLMGHSDISVTAKYYINIDAERKRESVEKITAFSLSI